jgi:cation:H+ antiporter
MSEIITYILFFIGFIFLAKGADYLIKGAKSIARRFDTPEIIISLTVVSLGTSAPELVINLFSVNRQRPEIALGIIIGSNLAIMLLGLGVIAVINPINIDMEAATKAIPLNIIASIAFAALASGIYLGNLDINVITIRDGIILLCFMAIYLYYLFSAAQEKHEEAEAKDNGTDRQTKKQEANPYWGILLFLILGVTGLYFGGQWVVDGIIAVSRQFGLGEFIVASTLVAVGSSLPEIITSITAALKKHTAISVGTVIGSCILNIFMVLGITALVSPLTITNRVSIDTLIVLLVSILVFLAMFLGKGYQIKRWQGYVFIVLYIVYVIYVFVRG